MKNTYVSLDMIFIRADGRILRIAENTVPLFGDADFLGAGRCAPFWKRWAGTARKLGIAAGDRVAHPIFNARR